MQWLAYQFLKLRGWTFVGQLPDVPKMIIIGAPHTTNWDFIIFLGTLHYLKIHASYIAKHTLFRWPFNYFFNALGGIPVDRSKPGGIINQVAKAFYAADNMVLVVAPEGTRSAAPRWKSGFLRIAEATAVPIVFAGVDFPRKRVTIGPSIQYRGDFVGFMDQAREFFADKEGLKADHKGPVVIIEEQRDSS